MADPCEVRAAGVSGAQGVGGGSTPLAPETDFPTTGSAPISNGTGCCRGERGRPHTRDRRCEIFWERWEMQ